MNALNKDNREQGHFVESLTQDFLSKQSNAIECSSGTKGHDDSSDQTVKAKDFSENEDENETDEDILIDGVVLHATLTTQADSVASDQVGEAAGKASRKLKVGNRVLFFSY